MKRRDVIKGLTLLPLTGGVVGSAQAAMAAPAIAEGAGLASTATGSAL